MTMLEMLTHPGSITPDQWKIIGILFLLLIGVLYFIYRTYVVIRDSEKEKYKPNIGLSRTGSRASKGGGSEEEDDTVH